MKRTIAVILSIALMLCSASAAFAAGNGLFAELARSEYADERMAALDEVSEALSVSLTTKSGIPVEIGQAYFEGNRVFIAYRIGAITDLIELYEGAPEEGTGWDQILEDWIPGEIPAYYPDTEKENSWLDGKGQRWLKAPHCIVMDGLDTEDGSYADIVAGEENRQADGSVIGWKECVLPEEKTEETVTFILGVSSGTAVKFQDYSTFRENYGQEETESISFTLSRKDPEHFLQGTAPAEKLQARAELAAGKVDMKGKVRVNAPEQAASVIAWQEGKDGDGTDVIVTWNLYRDGEFVSYILDGACWTEGTDELVFEVLYPHMENISGLALVPEYAQSGEHPEEAIPLETGAP